MLRELQQGPSKDRKHLLEVVREMKWISTTEEELWHEMDFKSPEIGEDTIELIIDDNIILLLKFIIVFLYKICYYKY